MIEITASLKETDVIALLRGMFSQGEFITSTGNGPRCMPEMVAAKDTFCKFCNPNGDAEFEYELSNGNSAWCWVGESHLILHDGKNGTGYESIPITHCPFCGSKLIGADDV